jgi:tRNA (guanosine-2'-O-)-methyltransferase
VTDRGVFAADRVDAGTKYLLLDAPPPPPGGVVVDLGCGYGAIAVASALRAPTTDVVAVDVNARARDLCRRNAELAGATNVRVVAPEEVPEDLLCDALYSNPPIRVGKLALHELLRTWLARPTHVARAPPPRCTRVARGAAEPRRRLADAVALRRGLRDAPARVARRVPAARGRSMKQLDGTGMKRLHRTWRRRTEDRLALLLDNVTTTFNVGGILRTAAALRVEHLWLAGDATEPSHPRVRRTALGAERYVPWSVAATFADAATEARGAGFVIVGLELADDAVPLHELAVDAPVCLALGHEDRGLGPAALAACDHVAYVPQLGRIGSLNVATAASIALYEFRRREWVAAP